MEQESIIFRGTWVSPIAWTLVIVFFFSLPVWLLFDWIGSLLFPENITVREIIGISGPILLVIWCWLYHRTLRVELTSTELVKSSFFGRKTVALDQNTTFRYKLSKTNIHGVDFSELAPSANPELVTNFHIRISNGKQKLNVGSAIKGIGTLFEAFKAFESAIILPSKKQELTQSDTVKLSPFEFQHSAVTFKSDRHSLPLTQRATVDSGFLILRFSGKRTKIPFYKIRNPHVALALLNEFQRGPTDSSGPAL